MTKGMSVARFKNLSEEERSKILNDIRERLTVNMSLFYKIEDMEKKVARDLQVSRSIVYMITASKKFKEQLMRSRL